MSKNNTQADSAKMIEMKKKMEEMEKEHLKRTAVISLRLREMIRNAMPAPAEQFFHVMVPGKVLNFDVRFFYTADIL